MPMTEEQARTKWCPMVRGQMMTAVDGGLAPVGSGHNRLIHMDVQQFEAGGGGPLCCVASECMAWRWKRVRDDEGSADGGAAILTQTYGYCGAFGKPEA